MSDSSQPHDRSAELRRALVATATISPYVQRRRSPRFVLVLLSTFVLAGALTGGAIASVSKPDPSLVTAQAEAVASAKGWVRTVGGTLIGHPFLRLAHGTQSIAVGAKPAAATVLVEGFGCVDPGHFVALIDGRKFDAFEDCSDGGSGGGPLSVSGSSDHVVKFATRPGVRYAVWLSWARIPKYTPSKAQTQALADGVVTRAEELAAYYRFQGCMSVLGHPLADGSSYILPLSIVSAPGLYDGSFSRCEITQFSAVDGKWRQELEAKTVGVVSVAGCTAVFPIRLPKGSAVLATPGPMFPNLGACRWIG